MARLCRQVACVKANVGNDGRAAHHRATRIRRHHYPLPSRLGSGEGSIELPHSPGPAVPGNA